MTVDTRLYCWLLIVVVITRLRMLHHATITYYY